MSSVVFIKTNNGDLIPIPPPTEFFFLLPNPLTNFVERVLCIFQKRMVTIIIMGIGVKKYL